MSIKLDEFKFCRNYGSTSIFCKSYDGKTDILIVKSDAVVAIDSIGSDLKLVVENDRYKTFKANFSGSNNGLNLSLIVDANSKDIDKYLKNKNIIIIETYQDYDKNKFKGGVKWVDNIIEGKAEVDRVLFRNSDFVFLPKTHWNDDTKIDQLACLAIVTDKSLVSLRDLNATHIPLLESIVLNSMKVIKEKYKLDPNQVRCYVHYFPTFWHLHIHFDHINLQNSEITGRTINVSEIIFNLKLCPDYYQKVPIEIITKN